MASVINLLGLSGGDVLPVTDAGTEIKINVPGNGLGKGQPASLMGRGGREASCGVRVWARSHQGWSHSQGWRGGTMCPAVCPQALG